MESLTAYFYGEPGGLLDKACRALFESYGGESVGAGTWMAGPNQGERDVQYNVPIGQLPACKRALVKAGFRLEPTKQQDATH